MTYDRKYQVFISSTFVDLKEERQEVINALLEMDCFPVGMELFPAASQDQWSFIKKLIAECDYYILIVGGRYGSINEETGISYTEMEYRYAIEKNIPTLSFLHQSPGTIPAERTERDSEAQKKLKEFKSFVKEQLCKFWETPKDLGGMVSRSLNRAIKITPRIGWVKADLIPTKNANAEILSLRKEVELLKSELVRFEGKAQFDLDSLAKGEDVVFIDITLTWSHDFEFVHEDDEGHILGVDEQEGQKTRMQKQFETNWSDIFKMLGPMILLDIPIRLTHPDRFV